MYDGCSKCTFSWPLNDPLTWKSDDAKCRCKEIINPQAALNKEPVKPDNLTFGEDCVNLTDQDCALVTGCSKCTYSWPKGEDWKSSQAKCRCTEVGGGKPKEP